MHFVFHRDSASFVCFLTQEKVWLKIPLPGLLCHGQVAQFGLLDPTKLNPLFWRVGNSPETLSCSGVQLMRSHFRAVTRRNHMVLRMKRATYVPHPAEPLMGPSLGHLNLVAWCFILAQELGL